MPKRISENQKSFFWQHGYVVVEGMLGQDEIDLLQLAIEADPRIQDNAMQLRDSTGGTASLAIWNDPGDDIFGALTRCEKIVESAEFLLDSEIYHYHSKITAKKPAYKRCVGLASRLRLLV